MKTSAWICWMPAMGVVLLCTAAAQAETDAELRARTAEHPHQLGVGVGVPALMYAKFDNSFGSEEETVFFGDEFLWVSVPITCRYRINTWVSLGGGVMLNKLVKDDRASFGTSARWRPRDRCRGPCMWVATTMYGWRSPRTEASSGRS